MKSPIVLLAGLWSDIRRLEPDVKGLDRDFVTIEQRFENEGYGFLTISLPALCDAFDKGISTGQFCCPKGFKKAHRGTIPAFLQGMFSEVFDPITGSLKETPNIRMIKLIRNVLRFFKKTEMSEASVERLDYQAKSEFFRNDDNVERFIISDRVNHLIGIVSKVLLPTLSSKCPSLGAYKHGPGAVFEGLKGNQKWVSLVNAIKNDSFDTVLHGYGDFEVSLTDLSDRDILVHQPAERLPSLDRSSRSSAKLISVAKNSTSRRTITIEPLLNQFIQQGLNTILRDSILECSILRNSLTLTDQSKNQVLALEGSLLDNWATIDLKSASDLLSIKLVESVFRHHPEFLKLAMACRSTHVQCPEFGTKHVSKFAGMGNALTFPVQSICFTVVGIASILDTWGLKPTHRNVMRASRHIRVYGDDIIVNTDYAHQCVNWLEQVGLRINLNKSYLAGNFKESCGVDAFMGVDISPIYIRSMPDKLETEPNIIAGLVSTSNQLWLSGLYTTSAVLANEVEERLGRLLPLVSQDSGILGWHTRLDGMTPHRWNRTLHCLETRGIALTPIKRRDRLDGYAALLKFFHVPLLGRGVKHLLESPMRFKNRLVSRWVPTFTR